MKIVFPHRLIWIVLLVGIVQSLAAQNTARIFELKKKLKIAKGVEKAALLNQIGFEFRTSNPDSTLHYCRLALKISRAEKANAPMAESYNFMGLADLYKGAPKEALKKYDSAFSLAQSSNDTIQMAHAYNNTGRLFFEWADLAKAYENFSKARLFFESAKDSAGMAYAYRSLSDLFKSQHDYENALAMAQKALALRQADGEPYGIITAKNQIGLLYEITGDFTQAESLLREAEGMASNLEDEALLAEIKLALGQLYLHTGSLTKALSEGFRAENIVKRLSSTRLVSKSNLLLGEILLKQKQLREALPYLLAAENSSRQYKQLEMQTEASFYLAQLYGLQGVSAKALLYQTQYKQLNDSLKNSELALQAEKFNFQLEIERNQQENELLKAIEQKNQATIRFQRYLNLGAFLILLIVGTFSYFLWRSAKARQLVNQKLKVQNHKLRELNEEKDSLMGVVAHDLKTPLTNIKSISDLLPAVATLSKKQEDFVGLIQKSTAAGLTLIDELLEIHTLENTLSPNLSFVSLSSLLQKKAEAFQSAADLKSIRLITDIQEVGLSTDAEWLGRSMDNLISNAIKFSPRQATVTLRSGITDYEAWISIKDEGPGFTEEDKSKVFQKFKKLSARPTAGESSNGLGLSIVKTLVERMKGTIALLSEPGKGSEFIIRLPMK
jgi:signal transduction histidine kinase